MDIIHGDIIQMVKEGSFDVIAHVANCFCTMKRGIAPLMHDAFGCNDPRIFSLEDSSHAGDIHKLGQIQAVVRPRQLGDGDSITVVNMYGQYHWSTPSTYGIPLDYDALRLCLRKMGHIFKNKTVGLPGLIGASLAGGRSTTILDMIENELANCDVKIVFIDQHKMTAVLQIIAGLAESDS